MEIALYLLSIALGISCLYYLTNLRPVHGVDRRPPGPKPLPIIGNLLDLRGELHHTLARLARVHGPVMALKLGLTTSVVVSSRDAAREAITNHDRRLAAHMVPDVIRALGYADMSMIWQPSSSPLWKTLRGISATHLFSQRSLNAARAVRERKVADIVSYFLKRASQPVNIGLGVYGGVLNLTSNVLFSVDVADTSSGSAQEFRELLEAFIDALGRPNVSDLFPFLRPLDLQGWRGWMTRRIERVFCFLDGIIDRRLADNSTDKNGDFLDSLLQLMSTGKIARHNVTALLFDVLVAGSDTISITVEWAMAELLRNPSMMARARAEIRGALGAKEVIEEVDAASLPYLQSVVKEAMRLHPVAPLLLPHQVVGDGVGIGGYAMPKGAMVLFNAWAIMRDPTVWEEPDAFMPERFLGRAGADFRGKEFDFIPFGSGRRVCPGLPMAERVLPFVLASLLHAFEWRLPDGMSIEDLDVTEMFKTANVMAVPLTVVPVVAS